MGNRFIFILIPFLSGWAFGEDLFSIPGELEGGEETFLAPSESVEVQPTSKPAWDFSGTFDLRTILSGKEESWLEGGQGRTLYGGQPSVGRTNRRDATLKLTRLALEMKWKEGPFQMHVQANADDGPSDSGALGLAEAWVGFRHSFSEIQRVSFRLGLLIPPLSLEHPDTAWSTRYTLTPSAINTWIGEEVRPLALEWNLTRDWQGLFPLTWTGAVFSNNDPAGSILAWRGWSLHDHQWRTGSTLPISAIPAKLAPRSNRVQPFKEIDGRPGFYTGLSMSSPSSWKIRYLFSHSLAPEDVLDAENEYTWTTFYHHLALEWQPSFFHDLKLISQLMRGVTWMGPVHAPGVNARFSALYLMASLDLKEHGRASLRFDRFRVEDRDRGSDFNDSDGWALTLAYLRPWKKHHLFGVEGVVVDSHRPGNLSLPEDPDDDLFSLFYRFSF